MTDLKELQRLHEAASARVIGPLEFNPAPHHFYIAVHAALPGLLEELERLRKEVHDTQGDYEAAERACDIALSERDQALRELAECKAKNMQLQAREAALDSGHR